MPELPEVETIKNDLVKSIVGKKITGVDLLWSGIVKDMSPADFTKDVVGQKIIGVERRAKNLSIGLKDKKDILIHLKMTGHLIVADGSWQVDDRGVWLKNHAKESPMYDPLNQYIRVIFRLDNGKMLAFSDLRKFAYIKLIDQKKKDEVFGELGPEPLSGAFTEEILAGILEKKKTAIKKVLMDQKLIAGIGNIYADEILWEAKIHPLTAANKLDEKETSALYTAIRKILTEAVKLRGTSTSDYRDTEGKKGRYGDIRRVYRRTGLPCPRDGEKIKRITVGGRGTHFCPKEQVLK